MKRALFLTLINLLLSFIPVILFGQEIRGRITNEKNEPIAFATIYVPALHKGTTANMEGEYHLLLSSGDHDLVFQYLGYVTQNVKVNLNSAIVHLDIRLANQTYNLAEVIVTASGEDPAYYIMRKAISLSGYYLKQVSEYTARTYLKGTGVALKIPALLRKQLRNEGIEPGKYFVTETISDIHYREGEPLQTNVLSTRSSGMDNQTDPMQFVTLSLYQDISGIISPLSRNAFQVYRFKLDGTFVEDGYTINKISVIPRRKGQDLYKGTIFIREGSWNIHSVDLKVEQKMIDIRIRQVYQQINPLVWMPVSHDFDILFEALGASVSYRYLVSVNDYKVVLNQTVDHSFYAKMLAEEQLEMPEVQPISSHVTTPVATTDSRKKKIEALMAEPELSNKDARELNKLIRMEANANKEKPSLEVKPRNTEIADSARLRPVDYWKQHRPVPLTKEELASFDEKDTDSVSVDTTKRKAKWVNELMFGSTQRKLSERWKLKHNGLAGISSFSFNTVDGLRITKTAAFEYDGPEGDQLKLSAAADYAFSRAWFGGVVGVDYLYKPFSRSSIGLSAGRTTSDFNESDGIQPLFNSVTTLMARQNFMKIYEKDFLKLVHEMDVVNGLVLKLSAEFADRKQLENNTDFYFASLFGDRYTANFPGITSSRPMLTADHKAFIFAGSLSFTARHYYRLEGKRKKMLYSFYPTLVLNWRQGISGIGGSEAVFQHLEAGIKQGFTIRLAGRFDYEVKAGTFLNRSKPYFADYKHFNNDPLWIGAAGGNAFYGLDFYQRSTVNPYVAGNIQYNHSRILIKRLPFLANSLVRERLFMGYIATRDEMPYLEAGYGVSQLFLLFNLDVVTSISGGRHHYTGFRIGVPIGGGVISF